MSHSGSVKLVLVDGIVAVLNAAQAYTDSESLCQRLTNIDSCWACDFPAFGGGSSVLRFD